MRLQSYLSRSGIASRRNVLSEIESGKVKVNGEVVRIPSYPIFPERDKVTFEGGDVKIESKLYFIFHKPKGVISTASDTHNRKTVLDYFKDVGGRVFPVGRLDQDTTGLLLMTNDGMLANRFMHPRYGVEKIYEVVVDKEAAPADIEHLEKGVEIEGHQTAPCKIKLLSNRFGKSKLEVHLHEGRKRQIRVMFQMAGYKVIHLHRKCYGPLTLKGIPPGQSRALDSKELEAIFRVAGLSEKISNHPERS